MMIRKETLQRVGLVAGSIALGLVIGIYATFQFVLDTTAKNNEIVDATADVQVMTTHAVAGDEVNEVEQVRAYYRPEQDGGGF